MAEITPKTRKPNFTESETLMILDQVKKHQDVLTSKLTDAVTNERKKDIWARISEYINNRTRNVNRTPGDIRRRWKNMVGAARKEVARIKSMPTGPVPVPAPSDLSMQILEINPEWQDFSSYNDNGPDPALSVMKVEVGDEEEEDDTPSSPAHQSIISQSPRPHSITKVADNPSLMPRDNSFISHSVTSSQNITSFGGDVNQTGAKKRRIEEASHLHQEILLLDRENLTLEKEKLKIEREKLSMEKEQLSIERQKLGMEREKLTMEKEKINMEKEKLSLEINYWKRKLLQITRNPYDNKE